MVILLGSFALFGCEIDPCADGNCDEVVAGKMPLNNCAPGFEGKACNIRSIDKFIGVYQKGKGGCDACMKMVPSLVISEHPDDYQRVILKDGILEQPFEGKAEGWRVTIHPQPNAFTEHTTGKRYEVNISGKAWIDLRNRTLSYKFDSHGCLYSFSLPTES